MALDPDLEAVLPDYEKRVENGETWENLAKSIEWVGDKRLAAVLRERAAGNDPRSRQEPPKARRAGNKSVAASKG